MRTLVIQLAVYGIASAIALAADMALLAMLVSLAGWHYLPASALSFIAGGFVAYAISVKFAFDFRRVENRALELSYFLAFGLAGLAVNSLTMVAAVSLLGASVFVAKLCAAGFSFAANFALRRYFLFQPKAAASKNELPDLKVIECQRAQ